MTFIMRSGSRTIKNKTFTCKLKMFNNINSNNTNANVCGYCRRGRAIARVHPVHLMNVERRQAAADPQTKPNDLGCESSYILHCPRIICAIVRVAEGVWDIMLHKPTWHTH